MAQQLVEKTGFEKHNFARTGRMVGYGGCMTTETAASDRALLIERRSHLWPSGDAVVQAPH